MYIVIVIVIVVQLQSVWGSFPVLFFTATIKYYYHINTTDDLMSHIISRTVPLAEDCSCAVRVCRSSTC